MNREGHFSLPALKATSVFAHGMYWRLQAEEVMPGLNAVDDSFDNWQRALELEQLPEEPLQRLPIHREDVV